MILRATISPEKSLNFKQNETHKSDDTRYRKYLP